MKGTERKLIEQLLVESEKAIAKMQLEVDSSINSNYPDIAETVPMWLLDRNKYLENTLQQRCKMKFKKYGSCGLWIL